MNLLDCLADKGFYLRQRFLDRKRNSFVLTVDAGKQFGDGHFFEPVVAGRLFCCFGEAQGLLLFKVQSSLFKILND